MSKPSYRKTLNKLNQTNPESLYALMKKERGLDNNAKVEFLQAHKNDEIAATLACEATKCSDKNFLGYLVQYGVSLNVPDNSNHNALYYAQLKNHAGIISFIENNPDVELIAANFDSDNFSG